jgi:uncharacterized protein (DUF927 family)
MSPSYNEIKTQWKRKIDNHLEARQVIKKRKKQEQCNKKKKEEKFHLIDIDKNKNDVGGVLANKESTHRLLAEDVRQGMC